MVYKISRQEKIALRKQIFVALFRQFSETEKYELVTNEEGKKELRITYANKYITSEEHQMVWSYIIGGPPNFFVEAMWNIYKEKIVKWSQEHPDGYSSWADFFKQCPEKVQNHILNGGHFIGRDCESFEFEIGRQALETFRLNNPSTSEVKP